MVGMAIDAPVKLGAHLPLDVTTIHPTLAANLTRGVHASCVAFHPELPYIAVASGSFVAVYDLLSGSRLGRIDVRSTPVEMQFAPDTPTLVLILQDWHILGVSLSAWRSFVLVPRRSKSDRAIETALLAISGGTRPTAYFCRYGKDSVRSVMLVRGDAADAKGRQLSSVKSDGWGTKIKLDPAKPIIGLAVQQYGAATLLAALHADGVLRSYLMSAGGDHVAGTGFALQVFDAPPKGLPAPGTLQLVPHPHSNPGLLVLVAGRLGAVCVAEVAGPQAGSASVLLKTRMGGWAAVLGMGLHRGLSQVLVFGLTEGGRVRAGSWHVAGTAAGAPARAALLPQKVEPADLGALLASSGNGAGAKAGNGAPDAAPAAGGAWSHSLWGPAPAWATAGAQSSLLEPQFGPLVSRVLVHPALGTVAAQLEPSFVVQTTPGVMSQQLGGLSGEELALARRTATVPLLYLTSKEEHGAAPRTANTTVASPAHASLSAWSPVPLSTSSSSAVGAGATPGLGSASAAGSKSMGSSAGAAAAAAAATATTSPFAAGAASTDGVLQLPGQLYYVSDFKLLQYDVASRTTTAIAVLPTHDGGNGKGSPLVVRQLVSSASGWLVFYEAVQGGSERWLWSLVLPGSGAAMSGTPVWLKPGKYGTFLGPRGRLFAVVEGGGKLGAVFETASCNHAGAAPLYTFNLEAAALSGAASPLLPGPPVYRHNDAAAGGATVRTAGVVLYRTADHTLAAVALPGVEVDDDDGPDPDPIAGADSDNGGDSDASSLHDSDDSDMEEERERARTERRRARRAEAAARAKAAKTLPLGHHAGAVDAYAALPLAPGESVLQVAWQNVHMAAGAGPSSGITPVVSSPPVPPHFMGAVLTTQRVLLVTGGMVLHAAVGLGDLGLSGCASPRPLTSLLWAGPALLVMAADGRVMQVTWGGAVVGVCAVAPSPCTLLVGATQDALLLARPSAGKGHEVVARPTHMLSPLLVGWASLRVALGRELAAWGGTGGLAAALRATAATLDPHAATPGTVWHLIAACAGGLAAELSNACDGMDPHTNLAAHAAAGRWQAVLASLSSEAERSLSHPAPPAPGTPLHAKLVAAAGGAVAHGALAQAVKLLQGAGEWRMAMVVAAAAGDAGAVGQVAHSVSMVADATAAFDHASSITNEAREAARIATALRALYSGSHGTLSDPATKVVWSEGGAAGAAAGAGASSLGGATTTNKSSGNDSWELGHPRGTLKAEAAAAVPGAASLVSKEGPATSAPPVPPRPAIPPTSRTPITAFFGLDAASATALAASAGAAGGITGSALGAAGSTATAASMDTSAGKRAGGAGGLDLLGAPSATSLAGGASTLGAGWAALGGTGGGRGTSAITADDDPFGFSLHDPPPGAGFDFSDSDDDKSVSASGASQAGNASRRYKIQIRSKAEAGPTGGGSAGGALPDLKEAAKSIKIGPYAGPTGGSGFPGFGGSAAASASSLAPPPLAPPAAAAAPGFGGGGVGGGGAGAGFAGASGISFEGLSPALAAGMAQPAASAAPAQPALSPALSPALAGAPPAAATAGPEQLITLGSTPTAGAGGVDALLAAPLSNAPPSDALYHAGVGALEAGDWAKASTAFSRCMAVLKTEEAAGMLRGDGLHQRLAFAAQYLAATRLVAATASAKPDAGAALYRYAAALGLDTRHRLALAREAVTRNTAQRNYKYAADTLTWMITCAAGTAPDAYMAALQAEIEECDRKGSRDASVPASELLEDWVQIVSAAGSPGEVEEVVAPLLSSLLAA